MGDHPHEHPVGGAGRDGPAGPRRRLPRRGGEDRRRCSRRWAPTSSSKASVRFGTSPRPRCGGGSVSSATACTGRRAGRSGTTTSSASRAGSRSTASSLVFDFDGASPQTNHFFNSKPYIIESEMVAMLAGLAGPRPSLQRRDLRAHRAALSRKGTIVNALTAGADRGRAHGRRAECVRSRARVRPPGAGGVARRARRADGSRDGAPVRRSGSTPGRGRASTGTRMRSSCSTATGWAAPPVSIVTASRSPADSSDGSLGYSFTDIEILESWYPILVKEKRSRPGEFGAGEHRAGGGNMMGFQPHGTDEAHRRDARHAPLAPVARWWRGNAGCVHRVHRPPR